MGIFKKIKEKIVGKSNRQNDKYVVGLDKPRKSLGNRFNLLAARFREVNDEYFDELLQILVEADISVELADEIINEATKDCRMYNIKKPSEINELVIDKIFISYTKDQILDSELRLQDGLTIILVVGVNGVGKTTTIAKLTNYYQKKNKKIVLAAGDTFRAAAVEQLEIWANRLNVSIVKKEQGSDPTSVIYDAVSLAKKEEADILICDTAGRMQNKTSLMQELAKIARVIGKEVPGAPHEVLLVIDSTTGQNGISQAKSFAEAANITGLILTKMDGTSKGGIVLGIKDKFNIPVRFIGVGEKVDDLIEFDLEEYLVSIFAVENENE